MDIFRKVLPFIMSAYFFVRKFAPFSSNISSHRRRLTFLDFSLTEDQYWIKIHYFKPEFDDLIKQLKP